LWFLAHALLLYVTNLLATFAIPTIVPHKTIFVISKGGLTFLRDIAQSLFVERCPLATQTHKQAVLTTIGLKEGVIELFDLLLKCLIITISEASQVKPSLLDKVEVDVLQEGLVEATMIGL
jgi:hypothetical protein